jgi:hypothetical protein
MGSALVPQPLQPFHTDALKPNPPAAPKRAAPRRLRPRIRLARFPDCCLLDTRTGARCAVVVFSTAAYRFHSMAQKREPPDACAIGRLFYHSRCLAATAKVSRPHCCLIMFFHAVSAVPLQRILWRLVRVRTAVSLEGSGTGPTARFFSLFFLFDPIRIHQLGLSIKHAKRG